MRDCDLPTEITVFNSFKPQHQLPNSAMSATTNNNRRTTLKTSYKDISYRTQNLYYYYKWSAENRKY